jgi:hypothetical protein
MWAKNLKTDGKLLSVGFYLSYWQTYATDARKVSCEGADINPLITP